MFGIAGGSPSLMHTLGKQSSLFCCVVIDLLHGFWPGLSYTLLFYS